MDTKTLLIIVLPLISGLFGSYLTYFFTIKNKKFENALKFKEENYRELLLSLQGFVGQTANANTKRKFFEEFYKSWLYCSDEVIEAVYEMLDLIMNKKTPQVNSEIGRVAVGKIVLAIRKDLMGKTNKKPQDFRFIDIIG